MAAALWVFGLETQHAESRSLEQRLVLVGIEARVEQVLSVHAADGAPSSGPDVKSNMPPGAMCC